MGIYRSEQERFWAGEFGDQYVDRIQGERLLASNLSLFAGVLARTHSVRSIIEFGANIGMNLLAIQRLIPDIDLSAVEINQKAVQYLERIDRLKVYPMSVVDFEPDRKRDLVLVKGLLIHVDPGVLSKVYGILHASSERYICLIEYYNPTPVELPYRGQTGKLFKRDFTGEMLDQFQDLQLIDYGFVYHRDRNFPQDDVNWFLLEKK